MSIVVFFWEILYSYFILLGTKKKDSSNTNENYKCFLLHHYVKLVVQTKKIVGLSHLTPHYFSLRRELMLTRIFRRDESLYE